MRKESVRTEQSALIQMICVPGFQLQNLFSDFPSHMIYQVIQTLKSSTFHF